jgi:Family of unknown function (DUF6328)
MRDGTEVVVGHDGAPRNENALERIDRNLVELLQEVRVVQTGVQVLFAFLLTAAAGSPLPKSLHIPAADVLCDAPPLARPRFC